MKKAYLFFMLFCTTAFWAQVGINTTNPNAQLDIRSSNQAAPTNADGILIPKIDVFPATNPTTAQQGMLVYLTTATTFSGNPKPSGFYYWNETPADWIAVTGTDGGTLDQAYDFGGAGAGKTITADAGAVLINGTDGLVSTGTSGSGALAPSGAGTRMVWNPRKAAFRAGTVSGTHWDDINIGLGSVAMGNGCVASGVASLAVGNAVIASGFSSTAFGTASTASGQAATVFGRSNFAVSSESTAFGFSNRTTSYGEAVFGIGGTTYTPSTNGALLFGAANANDRLVTIGNAIDSNNNGVVDNIERSDAMVILKNGATGIGTSLPNALLDIDATNNGILIPRVALTSVLAQAPVVNPRGGVLPVSTMIYNTATAGVSPNTVFPGFYYWNGTRWIRFDANGENNPTYYTAVGTLNAFTSTVFTSLSQMSITFTPKDDIALVNFSAAGHRFDDNCEDNAIFFQIVLNGIPVTGWQISSHQSVVNFGGFGNDDIVTWDTNISYPVTVPIGISQTIQIQWYSPDCTSFNSVASPFTAFGAVFKSYRSLTVIDPNGGGGIVGSPPVTTNLWAHNGNSGTNSLLNFVGTSDAQPLVLKSNNTEGMRIATNGNVGIGTASPLDKIHVNGNIRMVDGNQAAGKVMTSDANGTATWQNASANSWDLLGNLGTNPATNFIGTTDNNDLVFKRNNVLSGRLGATNTSFGVNALAGTPLNDNTAFGFNALSTSTVGNTVALGSRALQANTTGSLNTAVGTGALLSNIGGNNNIALGFDAMVFNRYAGDNIAIGNMALAGQSFSNGNVSWSTNNLAIGHLALNANQPTNTTNGINNVAVGNSALEGNTIGVNNVALGVNSLENSTIGSNNTANGYNALNNVTTGSNNTALGTNAFQGINSGSNNTALGADAATTSTLLDNATAIGYRATVGSSNALVLGSVNGFNGATNSVNVGIGTISPTTTLEVVDTNTVTSATTEGTVNVMTNGPQTIDSGGSITLGGTFTDAGTIFRTFGSIEARKANATTNSSSGYLILKTNNNGTLTERMRITNLGDVGLGTAAPGGQLELSLNEGRKPTSNTWTIPSDSRLKNVNGVYEKGLAEILQLKPIRYHYKNTDKKTFDPKVLDKEAFGFLAQEVQPLFPEAVGTDADGYLNFDLHPILIASVNALKELHAKNVVLEQEKENLKLSLQQLNEKVAMIMAEVEKLKK
ncbi:tail fiber domain-containing protein [Flavobacterium sp. 25HG05S-40]|uniref:tail fiber domain-containing protein n=1 Tax=Flavobacterium sp. 25HG05S-40 TaxID=3458682 RepID=UPI00404511D4